VGPSRSPDIERGLVEQIEYIAHFLYATSLNAVSPANWDANCYRWKFANRLTPCEPDGRRAARRIWPDPRVSRLRQEVPCRRAIRRFRRARSSAMSRRGDLRTPVAGW